MKQDSASQEQKSQSSSAQHANVSGVLKKKFLGVPLENWVELAVKFLGNPSPRSKEGGSVIDLERDENGNWAPPVPQRYLDKESSRPEMK